MQCRRVCRLFPHASQAAPAVPAQAQRSTAAKPTAAPTSPATAPKPAAAAKPGAKPEAARAAQTNSRVAVASQTQVPDASWLQEPGVEDDTDVLQQQQELQPPAGMSIPDAPPACTPDVVQGMSWGVATAAYQVRWYTDKSICWGGGDCSVSGVLRCVMCSRKPVKPMQAVSGSCRVSC
jgi:hypothetical protein